MLKHFLLIIEALLGLLLALCISFSLWAGKYDQPFFRDFYCAYCSLTLLIFFLIYAGKLDTFRKPHHTNYGVGHLLQIMVRAPDFSLLLAYISLLF